jgi:hypothetical protein
LFAVHREHIGAALADLALLPVICEVEAHGVLARRQRFIAGDANAAPEIEAVKMNALVTAAYLKPSSFGRATPWLNVCSSPKA